MNEVISWVVFAGSAVGVVVAAVTGHVRAAPPLEQCVLGVHLRAAAGESWQIIEHHGRRRARARRRIVHQSHK
jgi:hypothetical protein